MRKLIIKLLIASLLSSVSGLVAIVSAQDETRETDVRALALGRLRATAGALHNPALLPFAPKMEIGASVFNRFRMKELSTSAVFAVLPNPLIDASAQLSYFGFSDYSLTSLQAGLAKRITQRLAIGTNLVYLNENSFLEPESRNFLAADLGLSFQCSDQLMLGALAANLLHTAKDRPAQYSAGLAFAAAENCTLFAECGNDEQRNFRFGAGIEYVIEQQFIVRGGYANNPRTPSLGLAWKGETWKADTAFMLHPLLGLSGAAGISYIF